MKRTCTFLIVAIFIGSIFFGLGTSSVKAEGEMQIAIDSEGNEHYVWQELVESNYEVFYSNDIMENESLQSSGVKSPVRITNSPTDSVSSRIGIGPRTGLIFITWIENMDVGNKSYYAISRNRGNTWIGFNELDGRMRLKYLDFDPKLKEPNLPEPLGTDGLHSFYLVQFETYVYEEWKKEIEFLGGSFFNYIPQNTFVVRMGMDVISEVEELPFVRWVGVYDSLYKVEGSLSDREGLVQIILAVVRSSADEGGELKRRVDNVSLALKALGAEVTDLDYEAGRIRLEVEGEVISRMSSIEEVLWIEEWKPPRPCMDNVRSFTGADILHGIGYDGTGIVGGVRDTGIDQDHQEFAGQILHVTPSTPEESHGTSTFGEIFSIGVDPRAKGMMPGGKGVFIWANSDRRSSSEELKNVWGGHFESASMLVSPDGKYIARSQELDEIVLDLDLTEVWCGGNSGLLGPSSVVTDCVAKNSICAGALKHYDDDSRLNDKWTVASQGPAEDGRIKPDLTGVYDMVYTAIPNDEYRENFGGCSAATPIVAGSAGLVYQMYIENFFENNPGGYIPHASTVKAILIANAYQYNGPGLDESDPNYQANRYQQGWGGVDVGEVYSVGPSHFIVDEALSLRTDDMVTYHVEPTSTIDPMKISLVWTDIPGNPAASKALVNDLDLKVISPSGSVYWGNWGLVDSLWSEPTPVGGSVDDLNNVENVFIQYPDTGTWTIEVIGRDVPEDQDQSTQGIDQSFSLVISRGVAVDQTQRISSDDGQYSHFADIAVDSSNNQHIVWIDERGGNQDIYYSKLDDGGTMIVPETNLIGSDSIDQFSPVITVGPDPLTQEEVIYVFYVEEGYIPPWDKYQYQVRGKKFQSGVWDHLIIGFSVYNGYGADISDKSQIIDVHMDNSGELHMVAAFAYDASDKETGAIKYYFSGDGGLNWDTTRPNIEYFIGPPRSDQHYRHFRYPNIDCSLGGRLQVSFSFDSDPPEIGGWGGNTHIRASYSDDGNSWTTTGIGNTVGVARYNVLATDSLGYVYVAWHNYISGGGTYSFGIVWNRNPNNGDESSWMGQETLVDPASVDQLFPELVVDDKDTLNLIWSDNRDDNREIYMRRSHDNGDHWTRDLRLTFADESSYIPSAAVGSNRILHIVWQDYRDSAYEIYYRFLVDERRLSHDWEHSITPKTVVDLDGDTHIVWRERIGGGLEDWEIIYEKLDDEGNVLIKKAMTDDALDQYSPALAVGRNPGPVHLSIVYVEEKGTNDEFWHVGSTDGGITWTYTFITYLEVDDDGAGIDVAISQSGRIHAVLTDYMEAAGIAYERLEYYWSDDNGLSWLSDTLVYESYPAMGVEHFGMITYPNIATGGHPYVHITYAYDPSPAPFSDPSQPGLATSIEYLRSLHDGGYVWNWLYGDPIATTNEIGRYHSLVADLNGHVYVAWHDKDTLGGIPYCVFFARNWLNGASGFWNTGILADDLTRDQYTPDIAVDAIGNPHAVWSEERNGADELFHRTSFDLGVQWDIPKRLTISSGDSYNPSIYADNEGTLHITWQDTRGQYAQVYYRTL